MEITLSNSIRMILELNLMVAAKMLDPNFPQLFLLYRVQMETVIKIMGTLRNSNMSFLNLKECCTQRKARESLKERAIIVTVKICKAKMAQLMYLPQVEENLVLPVKELAL